VVRLSTATTPPLAPGTPGHGCPRCSQCRRQKCVPLSKGCTSRGPELFGEGAGKGGGGGGAGRGQGRGWEGQAGEGGREVGGLDRRGLRRWAGVREGTGKME